MKKILIVEDDQIVANIYRNKFSVEGFQVEIASDGEAGLTALRQFRPDAVILDLMLPKLSGVDLMKTVRGERDFEKLPIIVFSNTYLTNMVQDAWKAGATKCLSKANCSPKQLVDVVRGTLSPQALPAAAAKSRPPTEPTPASSSPAMNVPEAELEAGLRKAFLDGLPATFTALRNLLQGIIKAEGEAVQLKNINEMYRRMHALTSNAGIVGLHHIAQMADAIEALLKELHEKPRHINASTFRTLASAIDFLGYLFEHGKDLQWEEMPAPHILVVDDEAISRRAVTYALEKAKLKSVSIENPQMALNLLNENRFDLVFLDVDMPGMNGFELCSKLRALPLHKKTPVVFVTGLNDFESRANSMMSGGNDLIAKPFLFIELAVKSLVFLLRGRMEKPK